ncbi:hypothetical protein ACH5RR_039526 [Cinchona calisaya]|uniref:Uncharacterized protein n=1 Tax=Cinchona calisaya TaxID=153742 RepID=A0ABD2Y446_9GENT
MVLRVDDEEKFPVTPQLMPDGRGRQNREKKMSGCSQVFCLEIALFSIIQLVGNLLKIYASIATRNPPNVARVCVKCDLTKPQPSRVYISKEDDGFWQPIVLRTFHPIALIAIRLGRQWRIVGLANPKVKQNRK